MNENVIFMVCNKRDSIEMRNFLLDELQGAGLIVNVVSFEIHEIIFLLFFNISIIIFASSYISIHFFLFLLILKLTSLLSCVIKKFKLV